jgi:uncharacterized membrane protein
MLPVAQLHPIAVHFPIVFFMTMAAFDTVALLRGISISDRTNAANISVGLAVLSGLSAIVTFLSGDMAYDVAVSSGVAAATMETHESLGTWTAIFIVVWSLARSFVWWRRLSLEGGRTMAIVGIEIAGSLLIVVAAYFGGQLVYELGVNVTRAVSG